MEPEPIMDVAHLAHVELLTPRLDASVRFFTEIMGMSVSAEQGDSAYLRAYDDYEHHTLKLTASRITSYNVCYTKLLRCQWLNWWGAHTR